MTPRESAQDFAALLRKLMATKLTASTAIALLDESADVIEGLINELGDQDPGGPGNDELDGILTAMYLDVRRWVARNVLVPEFAPPETDAEAYERMCAELGRDPVASMVVGAPDLAPAEALPMIAGFALSCAETNPENGDRTRSCTARAGHPEKWHAFHGLDGRVLEFWPVVVAPELPWLCAECAAPTGIRCWSGFTHDRDVPVCASHSVPVPYPGDDRECIGCANHRDDAADAGDVRPPEWVCSGCQKRLPGAKPEDGRCLDCVPPASLALVQGLAEGGA